MVRILFQGDSITDGGRLKGCLWDLNHQIGHCYVYPIVAKLGMENPGKYVFINRGLSGDSVESIYERWTQDTLEERPDILSILLGINGNHNFDGCYPEGVAIHMKRFETRYRNLLDQAREQNPDLKILLMEPFALPVGSVKPHYDRFLPIFRQKQAIIREIAADYQAVFVPLQEELDNLTASSAPLLKGTEFEDEPGRYWLWDGIHPTESFHNRIAQCWLQAAAALL